MNKQYVIVGSGPAGVSAAQAIRKADPRGRVLLLSAESLPFYSRIRLPEFLDGRASRPDLIIRGEDWFREKGIELRLDTRVEGLDAKDARVRLSGSAQEPYDACLLATGANPFIPPFQGAGLEGVGAIRTVGDTERTRDRVKEASSAAAIGGGVLGLEMSCAIRALGPEVTVIEVFPWLLPRQLDPEGGAVLQGILEGKGLSFRLDAKVEALEGEGAVEAVRLEGGETLPASAVLVSAGVRPEVALAKEAGLKLNRGIVIDDTGSTSAEGVYASGDCAEHGGTVYGIWAAADAQGKVAGTNMAGGGETYSGTVMSHTLKVTGVDLFSTGEIDADGKFEAEVERDEGSYRKLVKDGEGRLIGAVLLGDLKDRGRIAKAVGAREALQ